MRRNIHKTLVICLTLTLLNCGKTNSEQSTVDAQNNELNDNRIQVTQAQFIQSKMMLGNLEEKPFPDVVTVNGMIDVPPENRVVVNATMGGYIKTTPLLIGNKVRKGEVLVTIENPEFVTLQQQYMEVHQQLTYLKSEYDRQVTMKAENITSQKSFLKAESDYRTAVAKHTGLEKQLRMINISPSRVGSGAISSVVSIYAPISGSITKVTVTKGSYVSPATEILEIINNDHIHLELSVFEKDIMKLKKGQHIDFKIPESSTETFKAEVHLVGTAIEDNRTIKVHGHLENESNHNFLVGMFVEAQIVTDATSAKALPSEAIIEVDGKNHVLVLDKKVGETYYFNQQEVELINSYDGYSIIESKTAFEENVQFLIKGTFNLLGE